ncbi:MAG: 16S rRNA (adenine(1518)-N(6)/adenine(1519)-N(6))-dimethyltransferase RsmA [Lachnospiraceae bacterium]|nr:16S rRNA (adenine(1518)-N(6)/adenine(1519)-N(6))-dimethyltransferase RsmA [Lachnospiraceae bacterium]
MSELSNPKVIQQIMKQHDFSVRKKYGQNFLVDANVLRSIVEAAEIGKDDLVLEIGPGLGALTEQLLEAAWKVIAVEVDPMLIPILQENLKDHDNLVLIHDDILKVDLDALLAKEGGGRKAKVVANLPYYITTPIVMELLEKQQNIESITVMVQKEVAQRMQEGPGSKSYGALSLSVRYYAKAEMMMTVSKHCFIPQPDVESAVIRLDVYAEADRPVKTDQEEEMFGLIRAAFNQRRKTLVNALSNAQNLPYTKEQILHALSEMGKDAAVRGETFTLEEFAQLTELLKKR